ncbi:GTPase ObgE [Candidatus Peregrinibacteria bacterium]|jgi:GTPase|nr:GTPase ObgE [Candidatus Peregrinibacteria bacterium]
MNFCDETTVVFKAGSGGGGAISFRREKFISRGGPDGGNGGGGGAIILRTNPNINTLVEFNTRKQFKAESGESGAKRNRQGKNGEDLILEVPLGTMVINEDGTELLADLKYRNQEYVVAKGGIGGKGNANFVSSVRQAPAFAELGEPGKEVTVNLELKLVADVGIIGLPSAGKSTLIAHISAVKPKIAAYHFTTLTPNLGVVDMKQWHGDPNSSFTVVDIPGLIEGAAEGKGLGHEFLRHVGRAKFLIHLIDGSLDDLREKLDTINKELTSYSKDLAKKDQIVVINKTDILIPEIYPEIEAQFKEFIHKDKKKNRLFLISAVTGEGLKELMFAIWERVRHQRTKEQDALELEGKFGDPDCPEFKESDQLPNQFSEQFKKSLTPDKETENYKVFRPNFSDNRNFTIKLIDKEEVKEEKQEKGHRLTHKQRLKKQELKEEMQYGELSEEEYEETIYELKHGFKKGERVNTYTRNIFEVDGRRINQLVIMTDTNNEEAVDRIHDIIKKHDIAKALIKNGARPGDVIIIAEKRFYFRSN